MARYLVGYNSKGKAVVAVSKYPYVDLRGKLPGDPRPSQGVGPKPLGSVNHWNGPKVLLHDVDQLFVDARYHMQKNWGSASRPAYTNGVQYEMGVGADGTKYRLRNPGAILWHCGNPDYNKGAFSNTFLIGEGQYPTAAALESMAELNAAQLELVGLPDDYCFGHLDIISSTCPGTAYNGASSCRSAKASVSGQLRSQGSLRSPRRRRQTGSPGSTTSTLPGITGA